MFDDADIFRCYRRFASVVPQQALALANSRLSLEIAEDIAKRLQTEGKDEGNRRFVVDAYWRILCRQPTEKEVELCVSAMTEWENLDAAEADSQKVKLRTRRNLVHAIINHNDFITIR